MFAEAHLTNMGPELRSRNPSRLPELQDQRQRNLANQRNFRCRRKQYIVELEQKIRACEKASVIATKHVQAAARAVAAENAVLHNLARARLGWSEQELDRHISQGMFHNPTLALNQLRGTGDCGHRQRGPRPHGEGSEQQLVAFSKIHQIGKEKSKNRLDESTPPLVPPSHISDVEAQDSAVVHEPALQHHAMVVDLTKTLYLKEHNTQTASRYYDVGTNPHHGGPNEDVSPDGSSHANKQPPFLETRAQESWSLFVRNLDAPRSALAR